MTANDPAMTIISAINAGIMVVIGNKYLYMFCVSFVSFISTGFWFQFYGGGAPQDPLLRNEDLRESLRHMGLTGVYPRAIKLKCFYTNK